MTTLERNRKLQYSTAQLRVAALALSKTFQYDSHRVEAEVRLGEMAVRYTEALKAMARRRDDG